MLHADVANEYDSTRQSDKQRDKHSSANALTSNLASKMLKLVSD